MLSATRCSLLWWGQPANEFGDGGYEIIDARVERGVLFAQREDLLSMMLCQLCLLFERVFLQYLGGEQLLQVVAKALMIVDHQFKSAFDAVKPCIAVSVLFRHTSAC